jgi:hypothetical protein
VWIIAWGWARGWEVGDEAGAAAVGAVTVNVRPWRRQTSRAIASPRPQDPH